MTGLLSQPIDAGQGARLVGYDEFGRPVYQGILGTSVYGEGLAAQPSRPNQDGWDMVAAAQSGGYWQPDTREDWGTPGQALNQVIGLLAEGALNGITAPGRAAQGQPVTMGDVWDTALDWGVLSAPMTAPPGALRAGAIATDAAETPAEVIARMLREGRADEITDDMMAALTPNDNMELARLYESGATGMDMPLDEPSRMARAEQMGFGENYETYHGTDADIREFRPGFRPDGEGGSFNVGIYSAYNPRLAETYAPNSIPGGNILPLATRNTHYAVTVDAPLANWNTLPEGALVTTNRHSPAQLVDFYPGAFDNASDPFVTRTNAVAREAARDGAGSVEFRGIYDQGGFQDPSDAVMGREIPAGDIRTDFYPRNIRSRFARFDPRLRHLAHLSAGIGGLAFLPGLLSEREANGS